MVVFAVIAGMLIGGATFDSIQGAELASGLISAITTSFAAMIIRKDHPTIMQWCSWGKAIFFGLIGGRIITAIFQRPAALFPQETLVAACVLASYFFIPFPGHKSGSGGTYRKSEVKAEDGREGSSFSKNDL